MVTFAPTPVLAKEAREDGEKKFMKKKGRGRTVQVPKGYEKIEHLIEKLHNKMRDAQREGHEGK